MTWTLCTSGTAIAKAGANANSTITASGTLLAGLSDEVEAIICSITRVDVVTNYGSLNAQGKAILGNIASSMIAQNIVGYNPDSIGRGTATLILNNLENQIRRGISLVENDKIKTYLSIT